MNSFEQPATRHISVLPREIIGCFEPLFPGLFLDCTFGGGGHSQAILAAHPENRVVAIDRDLKAIERARPIVKAHGSRLSVVHANFSSLAECLNGELPSGVLADLGMSTDQLWEGRGFSFEDRQLDMRMNDADKVTAQDLVNSLTAAELTAVLRQGGVRKEARLFASAIAAERPIESATQLAQIIARVAPRRPTKRDGSKSAHPATVVFQALRIVVNNEVGELNTLLDQIPNCIDRSQGRLAIIAFHSLEDQIVAKRMRQWGHGAEWSANWPGSGAGNSDLIGRLLTPHAVVPGQDEIDRNPSSRSARLRIFEFCKVV